jgi:hypothetical protein
MLKVEISKDIWHNFKSIQTLGFFIVHPCGMALDQAIFFRFLDVCKLVTHVGWRRHY